MAHTNPSGQPAGQGESGTHVRPSESADYSINARVMQVLARRWVDLSGIEVGTTGGVVLIKGDLEREPGGWDANDDLSRERFVHGLRTAIREIPGVVDVVMELDEHENTEAPWTKRAG